LFFNLEETINFLKDKGIRSSFKIMVGGAIVTKALASTIGADGYAPDAVSAVKEAKELMGLT